MDIKEIKIIAIRLRRSLIEKKIYPDLIILFGSYAKKKHKKGSDIDIAIISRDLGKDRFKEGSLLNLIASSIYANIEVVPIGLDEYLSNDSISPILYEIVKHGIPLL